jgi:hypothetical protein
VILIVILLVALTTIVIFFLPFLKMFALKNNNYSLLHTKFDELLSTRVETLLLSWFLINMPKLGCTIGRLSYGFTIRRAIFLNVIAISIVGIIIKFIFIPNWQTMYNLFINPGWLFYGSLFVIPTLWLYGNYVKDKITLWTGSMHVFSTTHFKNRSIVKFVQRSFLVLLVLVSGSGFIGWRLSQYLMDCIILLLLPIYVCFAGKLLIQLVKDSDILTSLRAAKRGGWGRALNKTSLRFKV